MSDIEEVLTEFRNAAVEVFSQEVKIIRTDGGENKLGVAMANLERALADFTAEMPGAIGEVVEALPLLIEEVVSFGGMSKCYDERTLQRMTFARAALAKLEGK